MVFISADGASASLPITILKASMTADRERAARGELVTVTTKGINLALASLKIAEVPSEIQIESDTSFTFLIPETTAAGTQTLELFINNTSIAGTSLGVLGNVSNDSLTLIVKQGITELELQTLLTPLGFSLESSLSNLGASSGPCSGELATINVGDSSLGEALESLKDLELAGEGITLNVDPRGGWSLDTVDYLSTIGAPLAHIRGFTGAGTMIAILDTGVSPHSELGTRFRTDLSYDFINNDGIPEDNFDDPNSLGSPIEGHGTPIAILAAGSESGVAPKAEIMGIKTCSDEGVCFSSDVIKGVCHALIKAPDPSKLILNMSLGGDTPIQALESILAYALEQGVLIAAAAGNQGEVGSPTHYPAAFELDGLVAVGAVEASRLTCVDFEDVPLQSNFGVGSIFISNNIRLTPQEFFFFGDGSTLTGSVFIDSAGNAAGSGQDISLGNINLDFGFGFPLEKISLDYGDYGGNTNIRVNGELLNGRAGLNDLNNQTVAGVTVTVSPNINETGLPLPTGKLELSGAITSFAIGGQEFWIDTVCPVATNAWQPAPFSTQGAYVDIVAPGVSIQSGTATANGFYNAFEGTSFATPQIAGALALWREAQPNATPQEIEANLKASASKLNFSSSQVGAGLLNLSSNPQ